MKKKVDLTAEQTLLVEDFCRGCLNFGRRNGKLRCSVFLEFWPLWNKEFSFCRARCTETSPAKNIPRKEILQVLAEEMKKGKKGGGGEKADRTNKTFGPARMKDNAIKWRWDEL